MNAPLAPQRRSARLDAVKPSPTIAMTRLAAEMRAQGKEIIGLSQGEPDFDTPLHIQQADKFRRENGLDYALNQISIGTGGKQIIYNALLATLDDGDEVIIPAPYWVSYPDMVRLAGGVPVTAPCPEADGFLLTASALRAAITPRTKWLILNSPSNPTGAGYGVADLKALAEVLLDHPRILILTDDMYEHIRYDGWEFATIAAVEPRLKDRTLTCNGVSKACSMTGWRIGFAGGPADIIKAMATLQSQSTSNPSSISQAAAVAALNGPMASLAARNETFRQRRDLCLAAINAIDGLSCVTPVGAFYLFPSCAGMIGRKALVLDWNLGDLARIEPNVALIEAEFGPVDILVNNTGGPKPSTVSGQDPALWRDSFEAMVLSVIALTDRVLPAMRERKWGRIITSNSSGVVAPIANLGLSNALRVSLVGWSKTLAREVGRDGITANVILPGRIATPRITFLDEQRAAREGRPVAEVAAESIASIPVGRYGQPEEYGDAVAFLASTRAAYITGSVIHVDGGLIPSI